MKHGRKGTLQLEKSEKSEKHYQVIKFSSKSDSSSWEYLLLICVEMVNSSFSSKNTSPRLIRRKTSEQFQWRGSLQNTWPALLKISETIKVWGMVKKQKVYRDIRTKCNVISKIESWNRRKLDKVKVNKVWAFLNISILIH